MSATTRPSEIGELARESIAEIVVRTLGGASVTTYAEAGSPLDWDVIARGEWDSIGVLDDDGDGATTRDLAELGLAWGRWCIPLPLMPTVLAKRHSEAAREHDGPVTFALPLAGRADGLGSVPYGQTDGVVLATGMGAGQDSLVAVGDGERDGFDFLARSLLSSRRTKFSPAAAREVAVVLAAESAGAAARLVDDGVAYVTERKQFGRPVGSFQAVKHHLANALIAAELAETAVIWGSVNPAESFRGSAYAIGRAIAAAELVVQTHGGIGFTWEMGLHFFLRRMLAAREVVSGLEDLYA